MLRLALTGIIAGALTVCVSAHATEGLRAATDKAARQMLEDAYVQLGVAYICQNALGTGHYRSSRTIIEQVIRMAGKSEADAVLLADDLDKKVRADNKLAPAANSEKCMETLTAVQTQARVSRARFEKAAAAERAQGSN